MKNFKKQRPKPPDREATDEQLAALQDLFSGQPSHKPKTRAQQESERKEALDGLFSGLERKPMGIARAEEARSRAKVIQKRQREIDPLEIEAAEQEKALLVRQNQRVEKLAAKAREIDAAIGKPRLAQHLQSELERISQELATGVMSAIRGIGFM